MQNMLDHSKQLRIARDVGYLDGKQGVYRPGNMHCKCRACAREYLRGVDSASVYVVVKRH